MVWRPELAVRRTRRLSSAGRPAIDIGIPMSSCLIAPGAPSCDCNQLTSWWTSLSTLAMLLPATTTRGRELLHRAAGLAVLG